MELWTGALSCWKCHWPDLKSAGLFRRNFFRRNLFRRNLFLDSLNIVTLTLNVWPIISGVLTFLLLPHISSPLLDALPSLNLLYHSKTDAWFMQNGRKAVWSIPYVSVVFFPILKPNFIAYRSSKVSSRSDYIFEIHQLWQSGFSRVYSNCCCSCWFEPKIIKIGQSSHMYSNNMMNFQRQFENAWTRKFWKLIECTSYIKKSYLIKNFPFWSYQKNIYIIHISFLKTAELSFLWS